MEKPISKLIEIISPIQNGYGFNRVHVNNFYHAIWVLNLLLSYRVK